MPRLVLLIDAENVGAPAYGQLVRLAGECGSVIDQVAVGDFSLPSLAPWVELARLNPLRLVMQVSLGKGKNSSDIALTAEALALVQAGHCDGLALATNDRDFTPLVLYLRRNGMPVFGFGTLASPVFRNACQRFATIDAVPNVPEAVKHIVAKPAPPVLDVDRLRQLARQAQDAAGFVSLPSLGKTIRQNEATLSARIRKGGLAKTLIGHHICELVDGRLRLVKPVRAVT